MRKLLIKGGHVVDPAAGIDARGLDLLLASGVVAKVGRRIQDPDARVVDAEGLVVAPGFVDMHVHLREPGHEEAETVRSGVAAAVAGGFTAVACMANTDPVNDNPAVTELILSQAARAGLARVWPIAAVTKGLKGEELAEYGLLKEAGARALSDDGKPVASSELLRRALEYAAAYGLTIIDHCEDPTLSPGWAMNEGGISTALGLRGLAAASEEIMVARDAVLAREIGTSIHAAHVSTRGTIVRLREEKARGTRITAEATPHHFTLTEAAVKSYDTNAKMNPPLRSESDRDAVLEGLRDGTIDCIASDHAPHHADLKAREFENAPNGVVGLETAVSLALDRLLHAKVVTLPRLVALLSTNPARILGVPGGTLVEGAPADVTVLDTSLGVEVSPQRFRSLSRNTPFAGMKLKGGAVMTIVGGRVVWSARAGKGEET